MTSLEQHDQTSPFGRAKAAISEAEVILEEPGKVIQETRILIERTRQGNKAYSDLADAIDQIADQTDHHSRGLMEHRLA